MSFFLKSKYESARKIDSTTNTRPIL